MNNSKLYYMDEENYFDEPNDLNLTENKFTGAIRGGFNFLKNNKTIGGGIKDIVDREVHKFPDPATHPIETLKRKLIDKHIKNPMELKGTVRGADNPVHYIKGDKSTDDLVNKMSKEEKAKYFDPKVASADRDEMLKKASHKYGDNVHMNNWKHLFLQPVTKDEKGNLSKKGYDFVKKSGERVVGHRVSGLVKGAGAAAAAGGIIAAGGGDPIAPVKGTVKLAKNTIKLTGNLIGAGANMVDIAANGSDKAMSFKDKIVAAGKKVSDTVSSTKEKIDNASPTTKAAVVGGTAGAALASGVLASKLIDKVNEKLDWKVEGCDKISDPEKKTQCKQYLHSQKAKELQSSLSKCDDANNPDDCRKAIQAEIKKHK